MPRKLCEQCHCFKIVYRAYLNDPERGNTHPRKLTKSKLHVCEKCAGKLLSKGVIFNLRRIISIELGTKTPEPEYYED